MKTTRWILPMLLLGACSAPPATPEKAKPVLPKRDLVAEVRAAGLEAEDALDVQPLRDPATADLRDSAAEHERAQRFPQADANLAAALKIAPGDPELWQLRAEIALFQEEYEQAEQLASSSYARGPKLGGLCRRNWTTVRLAREMRGDASGAANAGAQVMRCTVEPPVRM